MTHVSLVALLLLSALAAPASQEALSGGARQEAPADTPLGAIPNPFEGIETWSYPNGLTVYFKSLGASEDLFVRATLPVGGREDPEGLAGLAHVVEHLLFTGREGMSKGEFDQIIEDAGGSKNASTNRQRTDYWLSLPAGEWRLGLDWFADLMIEPAFTQRFLDEERAAVVLEGDLKPMTPVDRLDGLLDPEWAKSPGFWELELGIPTERNSVIGTWESVHAATAADAQAFFDRWYGPQNMTLGIFGNVDPDSVRAIVDARFGAMQPFGETALAKAPGTPRDRSRRTVSFGDRRAHGYTLTYVVPDMTREDWLWGDFLTSLLSEHLNDVLRQERQAAYGVSARQVIYRGHMSITVSSRFDPEQEVFSRGMVDDFLASLASDEVDRELFESLRARTIAPALLNNQGARELARMVSSSLYQKDVMGEGYPDPVAFAREASSEDLAAWMRQRLLPERRVVSIARPTPIWDFLEGFIGLLVVLTTFGLMRHFLVRPLDVRRIEYTRKVLYGAVPSLVGLAMLVATIGLAGNLMTFLVRDTRRALIAPVDVYMVHLFWQMSVAAVVVAALVMIPASIPRKILLLDDHWRVKYLSYRSRRFEYSEIDDVSEKRLFGALADRRGWPGRLLHWGPFRRGVDLRVGPRRYFLRTRDNGQLIEELERRRPGASSPNASPGSPDDQT